MTSKAKIKEMIEQAEQHQTRFETQETIDMLKKVYRDLEALHIIKTREIDVKDITETTDNYDLYVAYCEGKGYAKDYICSRSEFKLLREVLGDDK